MSTKKYATIEIDEQSKIFDDEIWSPEAFDMGMGSGMMARFIRFMAGFWLSSRCDGGGRI